MSKLKSDIILKYYKDNYFCNNGHNVYWIGSKYLSSSDLKCDKCGNINENTTPIRWSCEICKVHYCPECFKLTVDKYCPKKHKLKYVRQNQIDFFSTYTCDYCFKKFESKDGLLYDKECNLTFCPHCCYESSDIPEILED